MLINLKINTGALGQVCEVCNHENWENLDNNTSVTGLRCRTKNLKLHRTAHNITDHITAIYQRDVGARLFLGWAWTSRRFAFSRTPCVVRRPRAYPSDNIYHARLIDTFEKCSRLNLSSDRTLKKK